MTNDEKPKKRPVDEATLKRLAEGRLKGLEIRRKRAELKKQEKAEQREEKLEGHSTLVASHQRRERPICSRLAYLC